ncbi:hypothetical protein GQ602_001871 [Ophiocordyceps camponoti-floridani]|uniref:Uncharacterized protein n=1 Tax=Ophiocordyceps camponoti-floridani TaxID=2030778 RepID=A0A8H4Q9C4_9HYPO|nr:hypothetical protein GQ602_001871 [Ophiocordyceps camponoti-floridani]
MDPTIGSVSNQLSLIADKLRTNLRLRSCAISNSHFHPALPSSQTPSLLGCHLQKRCQSYQEAKLFINRPQRVIQTRPTKSQQTLDHLQIS